MKRFLALLVALILGVGPAASGGTELRDLLVDGVTYDSTIPTPESVLGFQVGDWHVLPAQLVEYARALAQASPRVRLEETGRTHEQKPLVLLTITSPANHARLEALRTAHAALTEPDAKVGVDALPVVVFLGYSIHGNEPSGSNASLLVAYHLAAAQGAAIESLLAHTVVLLDPALNPDGLQRFATWANMHRGRELVGERLHREHEEGWPSGRTNHYWFDLNRDWLPVQHPETQARLAVFHRWKPNVLADFHEMESDGTYFFQPGVPSRKNPLTPARNVELTQALAAFHARALDAEQRLYFTEERFDDFYYGKGSTYPDVNGAVGILFEQASARGHLQDTAYGPLSFGFAIRNQFLASLSTLQGAQAHRLDLLRYQQQFFRDSRDLAATDRVKAYVFGDSADRGSADAMLHLLRAHAIRVYALGRTVEQDGHRYRPGTAWVVPLAQPQYRLAKSLFERRTSFPDSVFYDVSTWTLPLAMGVPCSELARLSGETLGAPVGAVTTGNATTLPGGPATGGATPATASAAMAAGGATPAPGRAPAIPATLAYAFGWSEYFAPRALCRLLRAGVRAEVATRPFTTAAVDGAHLFERGSIVVPVGGQGVPAERLHALVQQAAAADGVDVDALSTGLTPDGVDLGSPSVRVLKRPQPVLVVGPGVAANEAGEIWHLLDTRLGMPLPLVEAADLDATALARFTHVLCVDGDYSGGTDARVEDLKHWVQSGGVLVAMGRAARWAAQKQLVKAEFKSDTTEAPTTPPRLPYADHAARAGAREISGAIFAALLDRTHPLGYGYRDDRIAVFRDHRLFLQPSTNPYATVAQYAPRPLLSGFISAANMLLLDGTASVVAERSGRGAVVLFVDNPNFRSYWFGTNKLLFNALFFGSILDNTRD